MNRLLRTCVLLHLLIAPSARAVEPPVDTDHLQGPASFNTLKLPASEQRSGDPQRGREYLITGQYIRGGLPLKYVRQFMGDGAGNALKRDGDNAILPPDLTATTARNGVPVAAPNCLACHAQMLNGKLVVGLGNATLDMTTDGSQVSSVIQFAINQSAGPDSPEAMAYDDFRKVVAVIGPRVRTPTIGVNSADRLAFVLAAYRDPVTLKWSDTPRDPLPDDQPTIPTDVPPWWVLKKKHAMFYTSVGRGDFARLMMASSLMTLRDTDEAAQIDEHFVDVLAYLNTLEPPRYPGPIDRALARKGRGVFRRECAVCHGSYDTPADYPNYLISLDEVGTDRALADATVRTFERQVRSYNHSWFALTAHGAKLAPRLGYVAPPLDGIWASAPYLHNGSVPTLAALLDSTTRPKYWQRSFGTGPADYDPDAVGWRYTRPPGGSSKFIYDTTRPGHGNAGHTYGDHLEPDERAAVIEYLKTL
ncbi:MAG: c-type cytochrome [Planctomycetes bacterium]|nr:c-type cytochrome [Planctomycetota bacterium]